MPPLFGLSAFVSFTCKWLGLVWLLSSWHHQQWEIKISTLEFLKCQSGGEFSLAIISSLRSWQGRRHSFESMPDCQRHIWLKLFHNFARAPRFSTEIDWWRSSESGLGCTLQISQWNLINSVKWMERLSEVLEMQSTCQFNSNHPLYRFFSGASS